MNFPQSILIHFVSPVLGFLVFLIFAWVIMSWLVAFNVINLRNPTMRQIYYSIETFMRPMMAPIQRILPSFGGLDFSPIVVLLILEWLRKWLASTPRSHGCPAAG